MPSEYRRMTFREFILLKEGRERSERNREIEHWQRTRLIAYVAGKPYFGKLHQNMTVYEFMPLPGDPTKEEIAEIKQQQQRQEEKEALDIIALYEAKGLIGKNAVVN